MNGQVKAVFIGDFVAVACFHRLKVPVRDFFLRCVFGFDIARNMHHAAVVHAGEHGACIANVDGDAFVVERQAGEFKINTVGIELPALVATDRQLRGE